ncbi:cupredoxin domain-containing protein [Haloprofundus salinisoli]|uniref:cupredoxin domain-containing protein n=1 Tax=Haloprofundus salinisoli TaxID=2876193 RepID=UPI001CC96D94|nr:hypothetical protein [Haloprofundus salinisoli]
MNRRSFLCAGSALTVAAVSGCVGRSLDEVQTAEASSGSSTQDSTDVDNNPDGVDEETISVGEDSFGPSRVILNVGGSVTWTNESDVEHSVTSYAYSSDAADWSIDQQLEAGGSATHTFDQAGIYQYYSTALGTFQMCGVVFVGNVDTGWNNPCLNE